MGGIEVGAGRSPEIAGDSVSPSLHAASAAAIVPARKLRRVSRSGLRSFMRDPSIVVLYQPHECTHPLDAADTVSG